MNRVNVILLCITALAIFYIIDKKPEIDIEKYETQINILQQQIIMLENVNDSLKSQSVELEKKLAGYDIVIDNLKGTINVIKKETKRQLDAIDYFGDDQLEQFFADRYRRSLIENDSIN